MKWNGIVSQRGDASMATTLTAAKAPQASSGPLRAGNPVAGMADGLDRRGGPELLAQPPDAHVDDVGARVEVVAPHVREQRLAADDLPRMLRQHVQDAELAVRERAHRVADARLAAGDVER